MSHGHARKLGRVVFAVLVATSLLAASASHANDATVKVRIARVPFIGEVPVYLASHLGYFADEGLEVRAQPRHAGALSFKDLLAGQFDIITTAETPVVFQSLVRDDFYVIAGLARSDRIAGALANRGAGINAPADLAGKRVGLVKGTASEYLLDQFLVANDLSIEQITVVDLKPKALVQALVNGEVDAMFSWQPHLRNTSRRLGDAAYVLPTMGLKTMDWSVVVMKDYAHAHPEVLVKYLRAVDRAIGYIRTDPEAAISAFAQASGINREVVKSTWDEFAFELYLSEAMLINMEDQARWMIDVGRVAPRAVPNFLEVIHFETLRAVRPESISIIQ